MRTKGLLFLVLFWLFFFAGRLQSQTYPSGIVTQFIGPRTLFLDEYADPFRPRIRTTIYFTDFTESQWQFALRLKITGPNGIVISTKPGVRPPAPLSVLPGLPLQIEGADLAFYFNYDNLNFSGISRAQLELNHRLPEGLYHFCFEAVDYESGRVLSHPSCAGAYLALNDPPLITMPQNAQVIEQVSIQSILLQWQLSNAHGNLNVQDLRYQVNLFEINNNWANPLTAIQNNQALPVWQSDWLLQNTYVYGLAEPPLEKGKRYVFTVRAMELNARNSFKNEGISMPRYFRFGYEEGDTIPLTSPVNGHQFAIGSVSQFSWNKPLKAVQSQMVTYSLRLVEVDSGQSAQSAILSNSPFYQQTYLPSNNLSISKTVPVVIWANIKRGATYAWQVTAQCGMQEIARSEVRTFTGPPEIERFIAGGFIMSVTKLSHFDKDLNKISGTCRTRLKSEGEETEFSFSNIHISPAGSNEWVMSAGVIADKLNLLQYSLTPQLAANGPATFVADSILVYTDRLNLTGSIFWRLPHLNSAGAIEQIKSQRTKMTLSNLYFNLTEINHTSLAANYDIVLLEPSGFMLRLSQSSLFSVNQSSYTISMSGFVQPPRNVRTTSNTRVNIAFQQSPQLFYLPCNNLQSEGICVASNTKFELQPASYTIDLSGEQSPGGFAQVPEWKGIYAGLSLLSLPPALENTGQLTVPLQRTFTVLNTQTDTNRIYMDDNGLQLIATVVLEENDSVKFNGFNTRQGLFYLNIKNSEIQNSYLSGSIHIPVLDTSGSFPYHIELTDYGFTEGYLVNALAGNTFTFNAAGAEEQRIELVVKRAFFRNRCRLELDMDLFWPYFSLHINNVQRFSIWGNNNIGFDIPNGRLPLVTQAKGKASGFDMTVNELGCGRSGNVYAFGVSAAIVMDEEISGEYGPPQVNAYSICRNPLLSGTLTVPLSSVQSSVSSATIISTSTSSLSESAAGYSNAISSGLNDVLAEFDFVPDDTLMMQGIQEVSMQPLVQGQVVLQVRTLLELVQKMKPFIAEALSEEDWDVLDRLRKVLETDVIKQAQVTNGKGLLNFILNKAVQHLVGSLNARIEGLGHLAIGKVRGAIHARISGPVHHKIDQSLTAVFSRLEQQALAQIDQQYHQAVATTFSVVRSNISTGIRSSVHQTFEKNITSKLDQVVKHCVISRVTNYVRVEVTRAGQKLISGASDAEVSLRQILMNGNTMFTEIADTVRDVMMNINGRNFVNTAESLAEDAVKGIDWDKIAADILADLVKRGLSQVIASQLSGIVQDKASAYAGAVLNVARFDFTNIGQKLQNGQLDQIVKFDPTNIYIQSPAADIRGTLRFTKADPVYGDSWQSDVFVRIKVPKEDNPVECKAYFINGKVNEANAFTYWMAKLGVSGLNIPLSPAPVVWDAADGSVYSKMKKQSATTILPDPSNKFGLSCKFTFRDQQTSGATLILALGAEAEFNTGGFNAELNGNASLLNFQKVNGKYQGPGFVLGTGNIGYYKTPEVKKVAGNFDVQLNTQPVLCAGGNAGIDLRGPSDWKLWIGTQENPFGAKLLCKNFLQNTAYLTVSNAGFGAGINANVNLAARSPWIELSGIKVRGYASFSLEYGISTTLEWEPEFKILEASVSAGVSAELGVEYETLAGPGSLTLAGVSLSGMLSYKSQPESELHGALEGNITVVGFNVGFDTEVHYSLSQQKIIN